MKRLYRSNTNKIVAGICGGIGEYFAVDPVLVRVIFLFVSFITGLVPGMIAYIISIFIIPKHDIENVRYHEPSHPTE